MVLFTNIWQVVEFTNTIVVEFNGALAGCHNGGGGEAPALSGHDLRASPTASDK